QLHSEAFAGVQLPRRAHQNLRKVGIVAPVARLVGIGQRAAGDITSNAQVIAPRSQGTQTGLDVAQTFAIGELSKGHAKKLIPTKTADLVVALIPVYATTKLVRRNEIHPVAASMRESADSGCSLISWEEMYARDDPGWPEHNVCYQT